MAIGKIGLDETLLPVLQSKRPQAAASLPKEKSFATLFKQAERQITFSQHALMRLKDRNIKLTANDLKRLESTVDKMSDKGAKESLIYMDDTAFVVSINNRTVITAMDGNEMKDNIFTNIDSAAIL